MVVLVHLPNGRTAAAVRDALVGVFTEPPAGLRRSLTWDQGKEMSAHFELTRAVRMPVFFCHPTAPGSGARMRTRPAARLEVNKGTDLAVHPA